jgi:hypothetical protein
MQLTKWMTLKKKKSWETISQVYTVWFTDMKFYLKETKSIVTKSRLDYRWLRGSAVQRQPRQTVLMTLSWKNPSQERSGGVARVVEHLLSNLANVRFWVAALVLPKPPLFFNRRLGFSCCEGCGEVGTDGKEHRKTSQGEGNIVSLDSGRGYN